MSISLPPVIEAYVKASSDHDASAVAACFGDGARLRDEGQDLQGAAAIQAWATRTIEEYRFHIEPVSYEQAENTDAMVARVSGTFEGSPVTLTYHFTCVDDTISQLRIG